MPNITKKFKIENMRCINCEKIIEKRMKSVDGVETVKTSYASEIGEVSFDSEKTDINAVFRPVEEEGYKCSLIEDEAQKPNKENEIMSNEPEESKRQLEKTEDSGVISISKVTIWKATSALLAILIIFSVYTGGFGFRIGAPSAQDANPTPSQQLPQNRDAQAQNAQKTDMARLADDDSVKGDPNAPVTIIEWSDYECPFCERFYSQTLGQIEKEYIDTGKVKFVYRDFPLGFHKNAQKAAEAAECAGEQGKYYEMHNKLFENGVSGGVDSFKQYAKDIGLDTGKFNDCLDSGKMESEVQKDFQDGQAAGISGTPGFIINGKSVTGAQPFEAFRQIIDSELAQ